VVGESERFVVRQDGEMTGLQQVPEVLHCFVDCQELPALGTVFLLCRAELPGEEGKWLPGVLHVLLEDDTHGSGRSIVTRASGADGLGWARRAACDRLTLHSLNAVAALRL
jgi:hypothetical protein